MDIKLLVELVGEDEIIKRFSCRQLDTATSLADVSVGSSSRSQGEDGWSIQRKRQQEEFQYQVVYKRTFLSFHVWRSN